MIIENKNTEILCMANDFCKFFDAQMKKYTIKHRGSINNIIINDVES